MKIAAIRNKNINFNCVKRNENTANRNLKNIILKLCKTKLKNVTN